MRIPTRFGARILVLSDGELRVVLFFSDTLVSWRRPAVIYDKKKPN